MGKGSKTPKAPDPTVTAEAQAEANRQAIFDSARVNQINEVNPFGSVNFSGGIGEPDRTRTTSLSASGDRQLSNNNSIAELLQQQAFLRGGQIPQGSFSTQGLPQLYSSYLNVNPGGNFAPGNSGPSGGPQLGNTPSPSVVPGTFGLPSSGNFGGGAPNKDDYKAGFDGSGLTTKEQFREQLIDSGDFGDRNGYGGFDSLQFAKNENGYQREVTDNNFFRNFDPSGSDGNLGNGVYSKGDYLFAPEGVGFDDLTQDQRGYSEGDFYNGFVNYGQNGNIDEEGLNQEIQNRITQQGQGVQLYDDEGYQSALDQYSSNLLNQGQPSGGSQGAPQGGPQQSFQNNQQAQNGPADVERATYDRLTNLLTPQYDRQQRRLESRLAEQGIPIGGEAYGDVEKQFTNNRDEAYLNAANQAVLAGRGEDSRLFGISQAARNQGLSDRILERTQPINELAALLGGAPQFQTPNFGSAAQYQVAPPDVQGSFNNAYQGELAAFNNQQRSKSSALGGLFSLGGSVIGGIYSGGNPAAIQAGGAIGGAVGGAVSR